VTQVLVIDAATSLIVTRPPNCWKKNWPTCVEFVPRVWLMYVSSRPQHTTSVLALPMAQVCSPPATTLRNLNGTSTRVGE